jgi:hypothetical protein
LGWNKDEFSPDGSDTMAQTARGRNQDRKRVAGGQNYEVRYEAKKTGASKRQVKRAIGKVGNSRKKVEKELH